MFIFRSNGNYLGFFSNNFLFSRDGVYLGWVENNLVWDVRGSFRGQTIKIGNNFYIIKNTLTISPIPRIPKLVPIPPALPIPQSNILPVQLPIGFVDSF
jgi:hypothetical protein